MELFPERFLEAIPATIPGKTSGVNLDEIPGEISEDTPGGILKRTSGVFDLSWPCCWRFRLTK